jgi:BlaI family transcriptional regulator, penicillinase repressor
MPRPRHEHPTPGELEVLQILWQRGPSTVREVMEVLNRRRRRAYTSVMSLLEVMTAKSLLSREARGRAFVYRPTIARSKALGSMVHDLVSRAFEGSASDLVAHLLDQANPSSAELEEIRRLIAHYEQQQGGRP